MYARFQLAALEAALKDSPVVMVAGARQTGKSTLVEAVAGKKGGFQMVTLDQATALAAALSDPEGFLRGCPGPLIIDEVQRAPGLFTAIKAEVDRNRKPGRYLLTGSANVLLLPRLSESLAGRMEVLTLWPLSQGEIRGRREGFLKILFASKSDFPALRKSAGSPSGTESRWVEAALKGGYPEPLARTGTERRDAWFRNYLNTLLQRDIRDLAQIEGLAEIPRLLTLVAQRTASLLNFSDLSRALGTPQSTLKRYITLLENIFLIHFLPPWVVNLDKRLVKSPKLFLSDTGLLAHLLGLNAERLRAEPTWKGPLLESLVVQEIRKQASWDADPPSLFHFRTHAGQEVDLVLEARSGEVAGVEVKVKASVDGHDFKGLSALKEAAGKRFRRGLVLYGGDTVVPFAEDFFAVPVRALWEWTA